ncbi:MAG: hypothetical protein DRP27_08310 [Thermotogae bacterium]|nr:MAG: hypothetical protein DRP27_08310 [Thermotogota bacterium]
MEKRKFIVWTLVSFLAGLVIGSLIGYFAKPCTKESSIQNRTEKAQTNQSVSQSQTSTSTQAVSTPSTSTQKLAKVKLADTPKIRTFNTSTFFPKWGWWIRRSNLWAELTFENIDVSGLKSDKLLVEFKFGVTNKMDGDENLDGLIDVQVNPGKTPSTTIENLLLANLNRGKPAVAMHGGGTYNTTASFEIDKKYVIGGTLVLRILRHPDTNSAPSAVGKIAKIEITNGTINVPKGVYENDDPKTVHINIPTNTEGTVLKEGVAVIWGYK